jgi:hypothetical protein
MITTKEDFINEVCNALGQANVPNQDHIATGHAGVFYGDSNSKIVQVDTSKGSVSVVADGADVLVKKRINPNETASTEVPIAPTFNESAHFDVKAYLGHIWDQLP